jgi:TPR repeat protein
MSTLDPYDHIKDCVNENDLKELYEKYKDGEDSTSIFYMGCFYHFGKIVDQDENQAIELFEKAVELDENNADVAVTLGLILYLRKYNPMNSPDDLENMKNKILRLFNKSAELGNVNATFILGRMYYHGESGLVEKDLVKGLELIKKSACLGNKLAINVLGSIVYNDKNILVDILKENEEIPEFKKRIEFLEKENQGMKEHIELSPNGSKYFELKEHFKSLVRK